MLSAGMRTRAHLTPLGLAAATVNPSFLALSPDRRHLYAVNEVDDYRGEKSGSVTSFAVEGASGKLRAINTVSSAGGGPCKITVDFTGKAAFVANYDGGSAASFRVLSKRSTQQSCFHVSIQRSRRRPGTPGRSSYPLHHRIP